MEENLIHCSCEKIIYKNEDTLYTIALYYDLDEHVTFTAVGNGIPCVERMNYYISGQWVSHPKYGKQLKVDSFSDDKEQTEQSCFAFLTSGLIKGVGEKLALRIVDTFGKKSLDVLENEPEKYLEVKGISPKKLDTIIESYKSSCYLKSIVSILSVFGLSTAKCVKIYERFHELSEHIIKNDTYRLCEIDGFGFTTVDEIARAQDAKVLNSENRYIALFNYLLDENSMRTGSAYMPKSEFLNQFVQNFNYRVTNPKTPQELINNLNAYCAKKVHVEGAYVCKTSDYETEQTIAQRIYTLQNSTNALNLADEIEQDRLIDEYVSNKCILSKEQLNAVKMVMGNTLSIITGGAGSGKTTVLKSIIDLYKQYPVTLMAPTGKASKRMQEATGCAASTIHSRLHIYGTPKSDDEIEEAIIRSGLVIIDEISMLDNSVACIVLKNLVCGPRGLKVVLVGDERQLPSVAPGNVLHELMNSNCVPFTRLTYNFRQDENSSINQNAQKILNYQSNFKFDDNFSFVSMNDDADVAECVLSLYLQSIKKDGIENTILLSPNKKESYQSGTIALNKALQDILNPITTTDEKLLKLYKTYHLREGDRVMQTKNKEFAVNGDVGVIKGIDIDSDDVVTYRIRFDGDDEDKLLNTEDIEDLQLAYACTVHKSQGSEYKHVILALGNDNPMLLTNNLIYTAVTRARNDLQMVGRTSILNNSVIRKYNNNRVSFVGNELKKLFGGN